MDNIPFSRWDSGTAVSYTDWSPDEPNHLRKKNCLQVGQGEKQCRIKRKYDQKCVQILGYRPRAEQSKAINKDKDNEKTRGEFVTPEADGKVCFLNHS